MAAMNDPIMSVKCVRVKHGLPPQRTEEVKNKSCYLVTACVFRYQEVKRAEMRDMHYFVDVSMVNQSSEFHINFAKDMMNEYDGNGRSRKTFIHPTMDHDPCRCELRQR